MTIKKALLIIFCLIISANSFSQRQRHIDWEKNNVFNAELIFEGTLLAKRDYFAEFESHKTCIEKKFVLVNYVIKGDSTFKDHVIEIVSQTCREKQIVSISHEAPEFLRSNSDTCIYFVNTAPVSDNTGKAIRVITTKYTFHGKSVGVKKEKEDNKNSIKAFDKEFKNKEELLLYIEEVIKKREKKE